MSRIAIFLLALVAPWALVGAAAGETPNVVPPGHSAAGQYTETLPAAGGEEATSTVREGAAAGAGGTGHGGAGGGGEGSSTPTDHPSTPAQSLGAANAKRLEKLGPEGKEAAGLAAAGSRSPAGGKSPTVGRRARVGSEGSSPVKQVVGELTGTSGAAGMGLLLPLLIATTAMLAAGLVLARRRSGQRD